MLRITRKDLQDEVVFILESALMGPWVVEFEKAWQEVQRSAESPLVRVDLRSVSFVDRCGKDLLTRIRVACGELLASGPMMTYVVSQIVAHAHHGHGG
jgi:hypothetical protein